MQRALRCPLARDQIVRHVLRHRIAVSDVIPQIVPNAPPVHSDCRRRLSDATVLTQVQLVEGALICPETGRRFRVSKGIPNLLLNEDEC